MIEPHKYIANWPDMEYPNFIAWLEDIERKYAGNRAILYRTGKQTDFSVITYAEYAAECRRIGRGLLALGLSRGDRVALWAENRPEWMMVWMGAVIAGLIIVPIDAMSSEAECANILKMASPKVFFCSQKNREFAQSLETRGVSIERLVYLSGEGPDTVKEFGKEAGSVKLPSAGDIAADDPVSVIFTSGTTGLSKGVTLKHRGIIANSNGAILSLQPNIRDVFINVLPLHHTYPTTCTFISPLSVGIPVILIERLVGKVVLDDIRKGRVSYLIAVPLLFDKVKTGIEQGLRELPAPARGLINGLRRLTLFFNRLGFTAFGKFTLYAIRKKIGIETVRIMVAGGGPLNPKTADFFDSLGFCLVHGYGLSENSPLVSVNVPKYKNNLSVGLPVKYTEVKIVDKNEDGSGEIAVKTPSLMLGYYNNPEATKEAFTSDGFLLTGDLGYLDEKGFIFINGRKKNLIVSSGGKNIYPEEIESCFEGSRVVGEILVMGRKAPGSGGELIFAAIYPNWETLKTDYPAGELDAEFVHSLIKKEVEAKNRTLVGYKKISGFVVMDAPFEKNAQEKIKRYLYKNAAI
ncbi:MAG: AMP-binding protein [Spirochaetaceae bacterium]|jgi:long-chain acyl-CoA synthetase|nr:AMP-binding protein [Spirochaetaceae bacterium]